MKEYPPNLSYGEQAFLYKQNMRLINGQWVSDYPLPDKSLRLSREEALRHTDEKLNKLWNKKAISVYMLVKEADKKLKKAKELCESIILADTLLRAKTKAELLKEVLG